MLIAARYFEIALSRRASNFTSSSSSSGNALYCFDLVNVRHSSSSARMIIMYFSRMSSLVGFSSDDADDVDKLFSVEGAAVSTFASIPTEIF